MLNFALALIAATGTATDTDTIFTDDFEVVDLGCQAAVTTTDGNRNLRSISEITYSAQPYLGTRHNVDVKEWENLWGYATPTDTQHAWPGVNGAGPVLESILMHDYVGAHFHTPADSAGSYGSFIYPTNYGGPNIDVVISTRCGDFDYNSENTACSVQNHPSDGQVAMRWWVKQGNRNFYCNLQPDSDYYLNIRYTNANSSTSECYGGVCRLYMTLNWGHL